MLYLVTESNGSKPHTHTSLTEAKRNASASFFTKGPDGDLYGYSTLGNLRADSHGEAPHLIQSIVRPISDPKAFLADDDQPSEWRTAVREATS